MRELNTAVSFSTIKKQISKIIPATMLGIVVSLLGAGLTVFIAYLTDNPIWKLAKDPAETLSFPSYIGLLSNWSALLWMASAAICLFSASILRKSKAPVQKLKFIGASGALSFYLALDDLFMLHDRILPQVSHLSENTFYWFYLIALGAYLIYFARQILSYDYLLLFAAFLLLGASRKLFIVIPYFDQFMTTVDMLKYFGIVFWLVFFSRTCFQELVRLIHLNPSTA